MKQEILTEEKLYGLLQRKGLTLATAESCTGGMVAARVVGVPGVSSVFAGGFVTYANEAKEQVLGVKGETLAKYGAVSENTAMEMAEGAAKRLAATVAVSTTGIAGPDGGTSQKPVGLVYIGFYVEGRVFAEKYCFDGDRQAVRTKATETALRRLTELV